jgi:pimeloyl-ACP methyl ester carboxylesterase
MGRYADAVLAVPTTLMVGAADVITRGLETGPVAGQPNLRVEVLDGVGHWVPEQRPQSVIDWVLSGSDAP